MTAQQIFAYFQKTGKLPPESKKKSTHGYLDYCGVKVTDPLPYALLQVKKKEYIASGAFVSKHLKIRRAD